MLGTVAAVVARSAVRAAVRYGRRRILTSVTGGVTLSDVLLGATMDQLLLEAPALLTKAARPAQREGSDALTVLTLFTSAGVIAGIAQDWQSAGTPPRTRGRHDECMFNSDQSNGQVQTGIRGYFPVDRGIELLLFPEPTRNPRAPVHTTAGLVSLALQIQDKARVVQRRFTAPI